MNTLSTMLNELWLDSYNLDFQPRAIVRHHHEMVRLTIYAEHDDDAFARLTADPHFYDWADIYDATASRLDMQEAARAMMDEAQAVTASLVAQPR